MEWRFAAAKDPTTPISMLESLFDYKDCRLHLSDNPSTPEGLLAKLGEEDAFSHLSPLNRRMAVANVLSHKNCSAKTIANILTWTEGKLNVLQEGESEETSPTRLKDYFYSSAANNPNTPTKYLIQFANSDDETTIFWLLPNPNLPAEVIAPFAEKVLQTVEHEHLHSISTVAQNPSLSQRQIELLSKHPVGYIRDAIARNPSTPGQILMSLINDEYFMVRIGCICNENLPLEGLEHYANLTRAQLRAQGHNWVDDLVQTIRKNILKNPNATSELKAWVSSQDWLLTR